VKSIKFSKYSASYSDFKYMISPMHQISFMTPALLEVVKTQLISYDT